MEKLDLNLMRVFHAVFEAGNVSRAAERLGLSQPAVSHALTKLRLRFRDPLFVRMPGGVAPTAMAERLARAVREALHTLEAAVRENESFDPASSSRVFRLHMSDFGEVVFLPRLMHALHVQAPGVRLEIMQLDEKQIEIALENGVIDLAFGYLAGVTGTKRSRLLVESSRVVMVRSGHPMAGRKATAATLGKIDYIVIRTHADTARLLQELDLQDNIRLTIPHFMVIPSILKRTDLAVLLPIRVAQTFLQTGEYEILKTAIKSYEFDVCLHWGWRVENDPGNGWLRDLVTGLFREE
jgi:DNA-binding transcriptional LysR family regulator